MAPTSQKRTNLEDEHTQKEKFEQMLHNAIERYRSVLEELAEL